MRKIALITGIAVAALPTVALAANPSHPSTPASSNANSQANGTSTTGRSSSATTHSKSSTAKVTFVIHGIVTGYTAVDGTTNGSISITFKSSNFESSLLKGSTQPLTFVVGPSTKIVLHDGKAIAAGDKMIVNVRAAKTTPVATLATLTASRIVDQGPSS